MSVISEQINVTNYVAKCFKIVQNVSSVSIRYNLVTLYNPFYIKALREI